MEKNTTETLNRNLIYVSNEEWTLLESTPRREYLLKHIFFRILNPNTFRYTLDEIPHKRVLGGMIKAFYLYLPSPSDAISSIVIDKSFLQQLELTFDELDALAEKNTPFIFKPRVCSMGTMLNCFMKSSTDSSFLSDFVNDEMFVLSNTANCYGASVIFYDHVLERIADKLEDSFYILPSSIHEVILIRDIGMTPQELKAMVKEVNDDVVSPEEVLSYHVFHYNRNKKFLSVVA